MVSHQIKGKEGLLKFNEGHRQLVLNLLSVSLEGVESGPRLKVWFLFDIGTP